jgi:hypothetical protein
MKIEKVATQAGVAFDITDDQGGTARLTPEQVEQLVNWLTLYKGDLFRLINKLDLQEVPTDKHHTL